MIVEYPLKLTVDNNEWDQVPKLVEQKCPEDMLLVCLVVSKAGVSGFIYPGQFPWELDHIIPPPVVTVGTHYVIP